MGQGKGKVRDPRKLVEVAPECSICGTPFPIRRIASHLKEAGHTKHLYCTKCKEVTAHTEPDRKKVKTYADRWGSEEGLGQRE